MPRPSEELASQPLQTSRTFAQARHRFDYSNMPQSARLPKISDFDEIDSASSKPRLPSRTPQTASPADTPRPQSPRRPQTGKKHPRISKPVEVLKYDYDVVVIGSGYGGGVAASRMARGKQSVCVLELGKERWPGEYPETIEQAARELHLTGDFATRDLGPTPIETGDPTDLYHLILGNGQNVFVANGLGGTSLLNANVFLEADEKTMAMDNWPPEIRENPSCLGKYYKRARHMLQPQVYPGEVSSLPKLDLLQKQAEVLGYSDSFRKVEQTTWFAEDGLNSSGVQMKKSQLTGMDSTGLNDGSKSSTLVNYLADAWNWGAEIFTRCEVRYIKKHPKEGYLIFFAWHGGGRARYKKALYKDLMWVHAKKMVFLGAGTVGSTEILLRSKSHGLQMGDFVGQNMSGNGDLLAFGYNLNRPVNGLARAHPPPSTPVGPTISGIIDRRQNALDALDGYVIEEGVIPEALTPFMQFMLEMIPGRLTPRGIGMPAKVRKILASLRSRFWGHYDPKGSLEKTQTYLIMCHDDCQAVLTLKGDRPNLYSQGVGRADHVEKLNGELRHITEAFNGTFVNNPFYLLNAQQEITVHPIGGAIMSSNGEPTAGVTNHKGQVLTGDGDQCYPGLVVVDASVIPTALGANPFATITALAERSVELVGEEFGVEIDYKTKNGQLNFEGLPENPISRRVASISREEEAVLSAIRTNQEGIEFAEIMSGYIYIGDEYTDYEVAEQMAESQCEAASFFLSVHAYDKEALFHSAKHPARLTGTFTSGALPNSPYMVIGGDFSLFTTDHRTPDTKNLLYDFDMRGTDGSIINFHGEKILGDSAAFSVWGTWRATTTLRVTLRHPSPDKNTKGKVLGKGILVIKPYDLIAELKSLSSSLHTGIQFFSYFAKALAHAFFAPLDNLQYPVSIYQRWSARNQPSHIFNVHASDGVVSRMMTWDPLDTTQRHMEMLFIPGAAVDESIFGMPTLEAGEQSAIDYFRRRGYRCFCVVHRVGKTDNAKDNWTTWDARLDITAALGKIEQLRKSGAYGKMSSKTYIVAHCAGSVALASGLLSGDIPTSTIAGITASQVFMTPEFATFNRWKAAIPYATQAYSAFARSSWYDCASEPTDSFFQLTLNQLLRFYPLARKDICNSVVCHRSSFIFGLLWSHQNLNARTHDNLHDFLGGISMKCQQHLIDMGTAGKVLRSDGEGDLLTQENYERLRGIPILFLSGTENSVYDPENTLRSFDKLRRALCKDDYERELLEGFGHLDSWMGRECAEKVFPIVNGHLERVVDRMKEHGVNGFARKGSTANGRAH